MEVPSFEDKNRCFILYTLPESFRYQFVYALWVLQYLVIGEYFFALTCNYVTAIVLVHIRSMQASRTDYVICCLYYLGITADNFHVIYRNLHTSECLVRMCLSNVSAVMYVKLQPSILHFVKGGVIARLSSDTPKLLDVK